ncbi:hypothetical protein AB0H83_37720 [Dactylosporangium sp. NPDC050688]
MTVDGAVATVDGGFDDGTERAVVEALVRTAAGVSAVRVTTSSG